MKLRLYIGKRRYQREWVSIDDIYELAGKEENLIACSGAKALLESTRAKVKWNLKQVDKVFYGNVWESETDVEFKECKIHE